MADPIHPQSQQLLSLGRSEPLAHGKVRDVFARPGRPDQLLKTIRRTKMQAYRARRGIVAWVKRRTGLGPYRFLLKEYRCYLRVAHRADRLDRAIPIAEFGAVIRTDRGLAQVSERIAGRDGDLAPTLRLRMRAGPLTATELARLNAFVADMYDLHVVAPDLNAGNVVIDASGRFLLVDGYGEKAAIPLRTWIRWLNDRMLDRSFAAMHRNGVLSWDAAARRFAAQ